jgi:hypothetical protein
MQFIFGVREQVSWSFPSAWKKPETVNNALRRITELTLRKWCLFQKMPRDMRKSQMIKFEANEVLL